MLLLWIELKLNWNAIFSIKYLLFIFTLMQFTKTILLILFSRVIKNHPVFSRNRTWIIQIRRCALYQYTTKILITECAVWYRLFSTKVYLQKRKNLWNPCFIVRNKTSPPIPQIIVVTRPTIAKPNLPRPQMAPCRQNFISN